MSDGQQKWQEDEEQQKADGSGSESQRGERPYSEESPKNTKGKDKVLAYITNKIEIGGGTNFWIIIFIIILLVGILWYFGIFEKSLIWVGIAVYIIFLIYSILSGINEGNRTKIFISIALTIWLIDLLPANTWLIGAYLGEPYAGFKFDLGGTLSTNWLAIATSGVFFLFLFFDILKNIIEKKIWSFLFGFLFIIFINNYVANFLPAALTTYFNISYGNYIYIGIFVFGFILAYILGKKFNIAETNNYISYLFMAFVFSFFWVNNGWIDNTKALIHAIFIIIFGFAYIMPREQENPVAWHVLIPLLLLADFYGYGMLWNSGYLTLKFIPIFVIFVVFYCYYKTESTFALVSFIIIVSMILILTFQASGFEADSLQYETRKGAELNEFFSQFSGKIKDIVENKLEYATGGYYKSQVEKNQFEPLGVYFDKVRAAQPRFYTNEDVTLWATIKSRTLSDPVTVSFDCFRWKDLQKSTDKALVIPNKPFTVHTLEERDVECTFRQGSEDNALEAGQNIITLLATYNFATSAYQKTYFIDKNRLRAMVMENLNPLREFGIKEINPPTVHTNGPVEIAVDIQNLVPVSNEADFKPNLGILLQNRNKITDKQGKPLGEWRGRIKKINEIVIILPNGISIDSKDCKPVEFKEYTKDGCARSCEKEVYTPCIRSCTDSDLSCNEDCSISKRKCNDECLNLFADDRGEAIYKGYRLDTEQLKNMDEFRDIDRYKTFGCRLSISKEVLENVPITTKFIRVRAKYDYMIDQSYNVMVEQAPSTVSATYALSDTDIDTYLKNRNSPFAGIGQCIKNAEERMRVPALVTLGVAMHDSKDGKSILAKESKNIFGIKCSKFYIDNKCTFADKSKCCRGYNESELGLEYGTDSNGNYRAYQDWCESVADFADLIASSDKYTGILQYGNNPVMMVSKLKEAGYSNDPQWADDVSKIIKGIQTQIKQR